MTGIGSPPRVLAAPNNWEGTQMTELSESRTHVAMTLDRLRAVDHRPIVGCWPSLPVATSTASLQLDPAVVLSCEEPSTFPDDCSRRSPAGTRLFVVRQAPRPDRGKA